MHTYLKDPNAGKNDSQEEKTQSSEHIRNHDESEGSEILDNAIRMNDQPLDPEE